MQENSEKRKLQVHRKTENKKPCGKMVSVTKIESHFNNTDLESDLQKSKLLIACDAKKIGAAFEHISPVYQQTALFNFSKSAKLDKVSSVNPSAVFHLPHANDFETLSFYPKWCKCCHFAPLHQ